MILINLAYGLFFQKTIAINMKFSLLTVTYAGLFYNGKALSVEQQIHKAKQFGFDGLAIETKRPIASPLDLTSADRARIKALLLMRALNYVPLKV